MQGVTIAEVQSLSATVCGYQRYKVRLKATTFLYMISSYIVFIFFHSEQYLSTLALSHTLVEDVCRCRQYMIPTFKKCFKKSIQKYRHASRSDSSISTSPYAIVCGNHRFDVRVTPSPLLCKKIRYKYKTMCKYL